MNVVYRFSSLFDPISESKNGKFGSLFGNKYFIYYSCIFICRVLDLEMWILCYAGIAYVVITVG
jgi:hypothetical protein